MGVQLAYLSETHQDMVSQIQWISDEEGFVTAGMDQKIIKWVGQTGRHNEPLIMLTLPRTPCVCNKQSRDGKMKKRITTGPMRIFDFALSKDGSKMFATANMAQSGASGSNVRPTASRMPVPGAATLQPETMDDTTPNYSIGKMEQNIVIYDMANGDVLA
jgi:hypothetical protein